MESCVCCLVRRQGKEEEFQSVEKYFAWASADSTRHPGFLAGVDAWIRLHNENPASVRLRDASELRQIKALFTVLQRGSRLRGYFGFGGLIILL